MLFVVARRMSILTANVAEDRVTEEEERKKERKTGRWGAVSSSFKTR